MINFSKCEINNYKYYGGKNGGKICIKYQNEDYMLKFPSTPVISDIRKEFYKEIIKLRYDKILKYSYQKLIK